MFVMLKKILQFSHEVAESLVVMTTKSEVGGCGFESNVNLSYNKGEHVCVCKPNKN